MTVEAAISARNGDIPPVIRTLDLELVEVVLRLGWAGDEVPYGIVWLARDLRVVANRYEVIVSDLLPLDDSAAVVLAAARLA